MCNVLCPIIYKICHIPVSVMYLIHVPYRICAFLAKDDIYLAFQQGVGHIWILISTVVMLCSDLNLA